jgi:hypothetical protein
MRSPLFHVLKQSFARAGADHRVRLLGARTETLSRMAANRLVELVIFTTFKFALIVNRCCREVADSGATPLPNMSHFVTDGSEAVGIRRDDRGTSAAKKLTG